MSDDPRRSVDGELDAELDEPHPVRVLMHNDDYTTMEFVVSVLESIFFKTPSEATQIMLQIHKRGAGVCGLYPREIAEAKVAKVYRLARGRGFPLLCSVEPA